MDRSPNRDFEHSRTSALGLELRERGGVARVAAVVDGELAIEELEHIVEAF